MSSSQVRNFAHPVRSPVTALACSPFEASAALLAVGDSTRVAVLRRLPVSAAEGGDSKWLFHPVVDFQLGTSVSALAWSPTAEAASVENPKLPSAVSCAAAGADGKVRYYQANTESSESLQVVLSGSAHSDAVNSVVFCSPEGALVGSVGDDLTLRLTDITTQRQVSVFRLSSPGVALKWHLVSPQHVLVGQADGRVKLFDIRAEQAVLTLLPPTGPRSAGGNRRGGWGGMAGSGVVEPLAGLDWCPGDANRIGAIAGGRWMVWDLAASPYAPESGESHLGSAGDGSLAGGSGGPAAFAWSKTSPNLFAVAGGRELRLFDVTHPTVPRYLSQPTPMSGGIDWEGTSCALVSGGTSAVHWWLVN